MKATVELPDELLIQAKKHAAEHRTTIRALIESGLRNELTRKPAGNGRPKKIRWVTIPAGLPRGLDLSSRAKMMEFVVRERRR